MEFLSIFSILKVNNCIVGVSHNDLRLIAFSTYWKYDQYTPQTISYLDQ